jgi:hypothetical protein
VDFIDEKHVTRLQVGKKGSQVPCPFQGGSGRHLQVPGHLIGDDSRQGGLAKSGRAEKEEVIEGFLPHAGRIDVDSQLLSQGLLADKLIQPLGPE